MTTIQFPTQHGKPVADVFDLGYGVARIERTTYVGWRQTRLTLMTPALDQEAARSVTVEFNDEVLDRLLEKLAWPK